MNIGMVYRIENPGSESAILDSLNQCVQVWHQMTT